jgi:hypothetical protein
MSLNKLSLAENNLIIPGQGVWLVTYRLETGKSITFFYSVWTSGKKTWMKHRDTSYLYSSVSLILSSLNVCQVEPLPSSKQTQAHYFLLTHWLDP